MIGKVVGYLTILMILMTGILLFPIRAIESNDSNTALCIQDQSIILDIKKKQEEIKTKEKGLADKEVEITARETALGEELLKLEELRVEIAKEKTVNDKLNEEIMLKFVETLERMSPKSASILLSQMDEGLSVTAISRISTVRLAKIMNLMDPSKASRLSELLALGKKAKPEVQAAANKLEQSSPTAKSEGKL